MITYILMARVDGEVAFIKGFNTTAELQDALTDAETAVETFIEKGDK